MVDYALIILFSNVLTVILHSLFGGLICGGLLCLGGKLLDLQSVKLTFLSFFPV